MKGLVSGFFVFYLAIVTTTLNAGTIKAELDLEHGGLDESFWITISIQGSLDGDVMVPESKEFEIQKTGQSTNISIINGSMSRQTQYTYQLRPLKEGKLTIPPFRARIDNQDLSTEPFSVTVKGGVVPPGSGAASDPGKFVFVEREVPKSSLYEGEVLITKIKLYIRTRLTGATPARDASPEWRIVPIEGQKNSEIVRDGANWSVIEMHEGLIPLRSGKLKAPAFGINATWIRPIKRKPGPRSIFDMLQGGALGMGEEVSGKLLSTPVDVTVKPLPSPAAPGFADIVGAFTMKADISKRNLNVGDTSTVTIEVKGQGALDRMSDIKLNIPGAKIYSDKPVLKESVQAGAGLVSTKTFKFAVVPQGPGSLNLGMLKLAGFNPFTEVYDHLSVDLGVLVVSGQGAAIGAGQNSTPPAVAPTASAINETNHNQSTPPAPTDLSAKPLREGEVLRPRAWYLSPVALAAELLMVALIIAAFVLRKTWQKVRIATAKEDVDLKSHLTEALGHLERGDTVSVSAAVLALKKHLAVPGQDPAAMTSFDVLNAASTRVLAAERLASLQRLLAQLDKQAYSDDSNGGIPTSMIDEFKSLLRDLEAKGV